MDDDNNVENPGDNVETTHNEVATPVEDVEIIPETIFEEVAKPVEGVATRKTPLVDDYGLDNLKIF